MFDVELTLFDEDDNCPTSPSSYPPRPKPLLSPPPNEVKGNHVLILRRDYQEFRALHQGLSSLVVNGKRRELLLPPLPMYKEGMTDADMAEDLAAYLHVLLANPEVTSSQPFLSFLKDSDAGLVGAAPASSGEGVQAGPIPKNAVDFLLQPCSYLPLYIPRRMKHSETLEVPKGSTVLWRFMVADGLDITFSMAYRPTGSGSSPVASEAQEEVVVAASKCPRSGKDPVCQGMYKVDKTSVVCTLVWDNTYSRLRGKQVQYIVQVVDQETMGAALEAAEELSKATDRSKSMLTARFQAGEALDGKVGVSITPVARLAVEPDPVLLSNNPEDFTTAGDPGGGPGARARVASLSTSEHERVRTVSGDSDGRRSSLGSLWGYITTRQGWQGHDKVGDENDPELSKVVGMIEKLEDDLASMTAKKEQAEAELIIALAKQRRWSIEKDRFERKMQEALAKAEAALEQIGVLEQEKTSMASSLGAKEHELEVAQEEAKRAQRARDVMLAEKHVWSVAHSGTQEELSKMSASLEKERQAHEDTRETLKKAREAAHKFKSETETLRGRLEQKVDEKALQTAQEELTVARAEVQDSRDAIAEAEAENDNLRGQIRVLVQHVKQQKHELAGLQGEVNQLRMHAVTQDKKIIQLRAEKKLLATELKQHRARTSTDGKSSSLPSSDTLATTTGPGDMQAPSPITIPTSPDFASTTTTPTSVMAETQVVSPTRRATSPAVLLSSPPTATSPLSPPLPPPSQPHHDHAASASPGGCKPGLGLEKDPRYLRLMTQLENCTERRQQLLALLEENPKNTGAQALIADLESVLSMLRKKLRVLIAEHQQQGQQQSSPVDNRGGSSVAGGK